MAATDRESSAVPSDSGTAATTNETTTSSPSQIQILDGMNLAMVAIEQWCRERVSVVWAAAACREANGRRRTEKENDDELELSRSLAASVPSPSLERTPHAAAGRAIASKTAISLRDAGTLSMADSSDHELHYSGLPCSNLACAVQQAAADISHRQAAARQHHALCHHATAGQGTARASSSEA